MKIITLNLRHNNDRWEERFPLVVDVLDAQQADIIGLQEVWFPNRQAQIIADALNARTSEHPYSVYAEPKWGVEADEGVAILSRLPVLEHARLDLPEGHRVAQRVLVEVEGHPVHIANTHLHHRPWENESIRLPQMRALIEWITTRAPGGWLLTGDMNAQPESETIAVAGKHLRSAYYDVHGEHPYTCPTPLAEDYHTQPRRLCIDYIFYDPGVFEVSHAAVIANQPHPHDSTLYPSDHFGLEAQFITKIR